MGAYQSLTVIKKKNAKGNKCLVVMKDTGFIDLWIGGTHYYKNDKAQRKIYPSTGNVDLGRIMTPNDKTTTKKQVIVIRKKAPLIITPPKARK